MSKLICSALSLATLLIIAMLSSAAEASENNSYNYTFPVLGVGSHPCSEWTVSRAAGGEAANVKIAWAHGFFSGFNAFGPKGKHFFFRYDEGHLIDYLDRSCKASPEMSISEVAVEFVREITAPNFHQNSN